jgi:hypothetical protein
MLRRTLAIAVAGPVIVVLAAAAPAYAAPDPISGAIFTADASGVPVNLNIYAAKEDIYLNGGPGINAPDGAAGLPEGPTPSRSPIRRARLFYPLTRWPAGSSR